MNGIVNGNDTNNESSKQVNHQNGFNKLLQAAGGAGILQANDTNNPININMNSNNQNNQNNSGNSLSSNNGSDAAGSGTASNNNNSNGANSNNQNDNNSSSSSNGDQNNQDTIPSVLPTRHVFTNGQKDILRLIGQHLRYLGLNKTTECLINESGCMLEHPIAANFCQLIMNGNWTEAENALNSLKSVMEDSTSSVKNMKFLILEQKYLEFLEDGQILEALNCLRDELEPLKFNTDRLHELSSFLMCSDRSYLKTLSKWAGKNDLSRQNLMEKLQKFLPPNIMLPAHRLETLLNQAIEYQCNKCSYHNYKDKPSIENWSFLRDHACSKDDFPSVSLQVLNDHCDEVWFCKFSNNGKKLASGSKDGCLIIWDVDPVTYKLTLNKSYDDHSCGVAYVAWSPDDRYVVVCGAEDCAELCIWDVENKTLKKRINNSHDDCLTSAAWMPDGQGIVTGGMKGHFYICDLDGTIRETKEGVRIRGLQVLSDGLVLAADVLKRIRSFNFNDSSAADTLERCIQEDFQIMSMTLNQSSTQVLVNVASQGIHLWDLKDKVLVQKFQGSVHNSFLSYSSFGGANETYVASGSEDNRVYIWNVRKEQPIQILEGHTRSVTCVSWNPEHHGMIVSASDDGTLRVWGPKSKLNRPSAASANGNSSLDSIFSNHFNEQSSIDRAASSRDFTRQSTSSFRSTDRSTPV